MTNTERLVCAIMMAYGERIGYRVSTCLSAGKTPRPGPGAR